MATPSPNPPAGPPQHLYTPAPAPRHSPVVIVGYVLLAVGFVLFMVGPVVAAAAGVGLAGLAVGLGGFGIAVIGGILLSISRAVGRRHLPPPPPIRLPPNAPGAQGRAVEIPCPNCGAAPRNIDRFGVATCAYCDTRFLVR